MNIFYEINSLILNTNGGYNWEQVYNMPVPYRKTNIHILKEFLKPKDDDIITANTSIKSLKAINERITPDYVSRASKK